MIIKLIINQENIKDPRDRIFFFIKETNKPMRLVQYIQRNLGISRRKIVEHIKNGKAFLNTKQVESYKQEINSGDNITIEPLDIVDHKVHIQSQKTQIVLFNKPKGYVVSKADAFNATIYEILPEKFHNFYYIGRLDKESHGLLLLTNDSALVDKRSHPSAQIEKEYKVEIDHTLMKVDLEKIQK